MSRIGNQPISLPKEVTMQMANNTVTLKGPKGSLVFLVPSGVTVKQNAEHITISRENEDKSTRSLHGYARAQLQNTVLGITKGWTKTLELSGVGYRATMEGANIVLSVGFSHPVKISPPDGITFAVSEGKIVVSGADKQLVGQVAASVRAVKEPEPYKGKGIKYKGEYVRKKAGKSAKAVGGAPGAGAK
jgi:large subunit ribosomal protein L6